MEKNLFETLPQEITIEIISSLPIDTIARCKCVCKAWRKLIDGSEFATSHRSKATDSCLVYLHDVTSLKPYMVCAFDGAGSGNRAVSDFGLPRYHSHGDLIVHNLANGLLLNLIVHNSANGLLLLEYAREPPVTLSICNPVTRECMELPRIPNDWDHFVRLLGFGASKVSGQYKVVIIYVNLVDDEFDPPRSKCEVYNLGLGLWRSVEADRSMLSSFSGDVVFLNGNLHFWGHVEGLRVVSCFDLEAELFTASFPAPRGYGGDGGGLRCLDGRLCLFDRSSEDEICIWFMNKYGDGNSWMKEYVVKVPPLLTCYGEDCRNLLFPIKVFKDSGDILFGVKNRTDPVIYSNSTKTIREYGLVLIRVLYSGVVDYFSLKMVEMEAVVFTPSFLSLRTLEIGDCNVESF